MVAVGSKKIPGALGDETKIQGCDAHGNKTISNSVVGSDKKNHNDIHHANSSPVMGRLLRTLLLGLLLPMAGGFLAAQAAQLQGMGFSYSRVVVMEESRSGASVDINNNTSNVYLMQSRVLGADVATGMPVDFKNGEAPFLVLPPLKRLDAQNSLPLRIQASPAGVARLPRDRESVFFLEAKGIPSLAGTEGSKGVNDGKGHVAIGLVNNIKLFWRPKGLKSEAIDDLANTLSVSRDGDRLKVTNPSDYYLTFSSLKVAGQPVPGEALRAMVPPRSSQDYPFPKGVSGGTVSWTLINEYGLPTKEQQGAVR
ncbi:molecular chaperone [Providencia alcalifaciens]|uniref:fimbrial biogenesis chaperone n=1 Tax=Providencia alcalifaciens TaxID=126385 RepID=UPI002B059589|nr:molecular chaperone [Providencia alcalifaciens]